MHKYHTAKCHYFKVSTNHVLELWQLTNQNHPKNTSHWLVGCWYYSHTCTNTIQLSVTTSFNLSVMDIYCISLPTPNQYIISPFYYNKYTGLIYQYCFIREVTTIHFSLITYKLAKNYSCSWPWNQQPIKMFVLNAGSAIKIAA